MKKMDTKRRLNDEATFSRVPMITIKDDMRDKIEANVSKLVGTVADAINKQIIEQREEEAKARKLKTPIVSDLTSLKTEVEEL